MIKGMQSSPLEHLLATREISKGNKLSMPGTGMKSMSSIGSRLGKHVNQPKVKPLASGFRSPSLLPKF